MSGVEETAPALEVVGIDIEIALSALFVLAVLIGIRAAWDDTIGALINALANVLDTKVWRINLKLGGPLRKFEASIEAGMGAAILKNEKALGLWWHANTKVVEYVADSVEWLASSTAHAVGNIVHGTIPRVTTTIVQPVRTEVRTVRRVSAAAVRDLERTLTRKAKAIEGELAHDFGQAWRGIDYLRGTAIPRLWKDVRGLDAEVGRLDHQVGRVIPHRLTRLEKLLGATVLGGIAVAAMTRVFPYWQCSNVKRFNREVCRSPLGSLDFLLGLATLTTLLVDPKIVVSIGEEVESVLRPGLEVMADVSQESFAQAEEDVLAGFLKFLAG